MVITGLLVIFMLVFTLVAAISILSITQSAIFEQLTFFEAVELYLIESATLVIFSYLLYRVTIHLVRSQNKELQ
ncbi:hypothetical protein C447_00635 [Halococcus hamelinensis 100A6]|uniref:Uncharacterized protein n=1 Tax=Halococcus hamelinensis 100A6 TaxID=1132509 RepID=M0M8K2_9EURY|nr:hypothetical protein C447_00635 [Halococcus hamelinensis 100A6]